MVPMFDARLTVIGAALGVPTEEAIKNGDALNGVEVILTVGQQLPLSQGPGAPPLMIETGKIRYELDRDTAEEFFKGGTDAVATLPPTSKIQIASSMSDADRAAESLGKIRDGK